MEQLSAWIDYVTAHPGIAVAVVAAVGVLGYLLNRKPKTVREAEKRLGQLRDERAGQYNRLRPPS